MWEWICGNGIAEIVYKKNLLQLVCGNAIAEIEERYKKKYAYSYSFNIFFWPKQFGLSCSFMVKVPYETDKDRFKYIDSYSKVYAVNKNKNKKNKKYIDSYRRKND